MLQAWFVLCVRVGALASPCRDQLSRAKDRASVCTSAFSPWTSGGARWQLHGVLLRHAQGAARTSCSIPCCLVRPRLPWIQMVGDGWVRVGIIGGIDQTLRVSEFAVISILLLSCCSQIICARVAGPWSTAGSACDRQSLGAEYGSWPIVLAKMCQGELVHSDKQGQLETSARGSIEEITKVHVPAWTGCRRKARSRSPILPQPPHALGKGVLL